MNKEVRRKFLTGKSCASCGTKNNLTVDHIVPRSFLHPFGFMDVYNDRENLQAMCEPCNKAKGMTLDYKNPKTILFMNKILDRWVYFNQIPQAKKRHYIFKELEIKCEDTVTYFSPQ